jgi:hydroxymethylbilane synthase
MSRTIRVGTRGSALAVAQSGLVVGALERAGVTVEVVTVSTPGDRPAALIAQIGIGVFSSALREALAEGTVDVAVHSYTHAPCSAATVFPPATSPSAT